MIRKLTYSRFSLSKLCRGMLIHTIDGVAWASFLLAMIGFVLAVIPFILFIKGSKIRSASKVVQTLKRIEGIGGDEGRKVVSEDQGKANIESKTQLPSENVEGVHKGLKKSSGT